MGIMDKAKEMAQKARNAAKPDEMMDKGAEKAKDMSGHKHDDKIDQGAQKAKEAGDRMQGDER